MLLFSIPWAVVLHPGATQNGRLPGFYARALRWTGLKENSDRQEAAAQRAREDARRPNVVACATEEEHDALESEPPAKRRRPSPSFYMAFTSGSLELVIQRMVEEQNVGRAVSPLSRF